VSVRVLRWFAAAIAVAALADPAITTERRTDAVLAVFPSDPRADGALAERVADELERRFTVVRGAFGAADAAVVVGTRLPAAAASIGAPAFAVVPTPGRPVLSVEAVHAPERAPLDARVTVVATVRATGGAGGRVDVTLRADDVVTDRASSVVGTDDERAHVPLSFVPTRTGPVHLRVEAVLVAAGEPRSAAAAALLEVGAPRLRVLFFDARPTWLSTFVRRSLEQDPGFVIHARVITSRDISTAFGTPPARLDDAGLDEYDVVVVGAPEALSAADVAGLERFMRRRGGSVTLLYDRRAAGPIDRLVTVRDWAVRPDGEPVRIDRAPRIGQASTVPALLASAFAWPVGLPAGARPIALADGAAPDAAAARPLVWSAPVGAGRLIVSGAYDAWRFRDRDAARFDAFWRTVIGDAAAAAPAALALELDRNVARPGEPVHAGVTLRTAALGVRTGDGGPVVATAIGAAIRPVSDPAGMALSDAAATPLGVLPDGPAGSLAATFSAPSEPGLYEVTVHADGITMTRPLLVTRDAVAAGREERDLLAAWAAARGGAAIDAARLASLPDALEMTLDAPRRSERWHPMRSPWWIIPFAVALAGEWWWRRRRGMP
jgi:hypothetical protein